MDYIDKGAVTAVDIQNILQGFRNKKSVDMLLKLEKILIEQKEQLVPKPKEGASVKEQKEWAADLVQLLFSFSSDRKLTYGSYSHYARETVD